MNIVESASPAKQLVTACKSTELVTLAMSVDNDTNVTIDDFWSEVERGKGHASAVMRDLVAKADELGVTLWLTAYPMHYETQWGDYDDDPRDVVALNKQALNARQLVKFYEKFGFKVVIGDIEDGPTMERVPRTKPITEEATDADAHALMADVTSFARKNAVTIEFRFPAFYAPEIEVTDLFADVTGQGNGTKVMTYLCQKADEAGFNLYLKPSEPRNKVFYARFGFEPSTLHPGFMIRYAPFDPEDDN